MQHANLERTACASPRDSGRAGRAVDLVATAIVFDGARKISTRRLELVAPTDSDLVVDVSWSAISTGTERLMWTGDMPAFPGMGYPLVPGYEAVGRVVAAGPDFESRIGEQVFVPGSRGFKDVRGLFGGAASRLVVAADRVIAAPEALADRNVLLALAATAHHAIAGGAIPDLIVGHGVLGRLLARLAIALGGASPVVWEINPERADADGYAVIEPECDGRKDYRAIYDASGDARLLDELIARLAPRGEITLAGFYSDRPSFSFPPAFMREARFRVAAEWTRADLDAVTALIASGALSLEGLVTHASDVGDAEAAYETAFSDPACLKMVIDWRGLHGGIV